MKAALYIRVSSHRQEDRDSLPFQKQETLDYARYTLKINNTEYFIDSARSAKNTDRPEFEHMMNRIRSGEFTHLIIWKIDRISRNVKDFAIMYEELKHHDVDLISVTEHFDTTTAVGNAMLQQIMVFAELERNMTSERVQAIMLNRAQKGLWNGATVPIGFVWCDETKFPVPDPQEVKVVKLIYNLYSKLGSTLQVAAKLNNNNIPTKRGGRWLAKTIRDVLRNPFYIGTYRYNLRDYSKNTYGFKDESEWIVIKDNHEAIIDEDTFKKVNQMLTENYRGLDTVRRRNTNVHIFSKKLFCGKCESLMTSGLDTKRKDGYQPSRYTCSTYNTRGVETYCGNFISDIVIGPFLFNYIGNIIRMQDNIYDTMTLKSLEKALLHGNVFNDVVGLEDESLQQTLNVFSSGVSDDEFNKNLNDFKDDRQQERDKLNRDKRKYEIALDRLDDLYLFSDAGMSKKDYLIKKKDIEGKLKTVEEELEEMKMEPEKIDTQLFIDKAQYVLITKELQQSSNVDFRKLFDLIGKDMLEDFIESVVDEVIVSDRQVHSITFKNGIIHKFVHKPLDDVSPASRYEYPENGAYRMYFDDMIDYLKRHESVSRADVEQLFGIKRYSALTLLNELIAMDKIERKRESVAVRYYLKQ